MRDRQIDVLRAMGIFFVVLGHTASIFSPWTYTFHMPLFFFISGFLRYGGREKPWGRFLKDKAKGSLIPYAAFWLVSLCYSQVLSLTSGQGLEPFGWKQIQGFLLGGQYLAASSVNFPLWFFQLFFLAVVAFEAVLRYVPRKGLPVAGVVLALVTVPFQKLLPGRPAFHINILPAAVVFMLLGYGTKLLLERSPKLAKHKGNFLLGLVLVAVGAAVSLPFDTNVSEIRRLTYFPGAYLSVLGFYLLSRLFVRSRLVRYIGESSLYILGLHSLLWDVSGDLARIFCQTLHLGSDTLETLIMVVISMAICCLLKEGWLLLRRWGTRKEKVPENLEKCE